MAEPKQGLFCDIQPAKFPPKVRPRLGFISAPRRALPPAPITLGPATIESTLSPPGSAWGHHRRAHLPGPPLTQRMRRWRCTLRTNGTLQHEDPVQTGEKRADPPLIRHIPAPPRLVPSELSTGRAPRDRRLLNVRNISPFTGSKTNSAREHGRASGRRRPS
jgi:hypothetical protein